MNIATALTTLNTSITNAQNKIMANELSHLYRMQQCYHNNMNINGFLNTLMSTCSKLPMRRVIYER